MSLPLRYQPSRRMHTLWDDLDGDAAHLDRVRTDLRGPMLGSVFDVTNFASDTVSIALLAVAELWAARTADDLPMITVDRRSAVAAFKCEALLHAEGWELPPVWDPVAGDYRTADGWIRLHTNYVHHRTAALAVLDAAADRESVADAVRRWIGDDLEMAIIEAGGCAAVMRSEAEWRASPAGRATAADAPITLGTPVDIDGSLSVGVASTRIVRPLEGIRILDLTRVIAGPLATRLLAGYGAEVIRVDPPGFEEVGALLPDMTAGKKCVALDLTSPQDRDRFFALLRDAHVVVGGLRPGALPGLGLDPSSLRAVNPHIITVTHDAYGWNGPWAGRRGFDSLVQMSTGIAAAGMAAAGADHPVPLPAQALDHGLGHLLAGATCRALARLATTGKASDVRGSLVGAANALMQSPTPDGNTVSAPRWDERDTVAATTAWGPIRRAPLAGHIDGHEPRWSIDAGPLGRDTPRWDAT